MVTISALGHVWSRNLLVVMLVLGLGVASPSLAANELQKLLANHPTGIDGYQYNHQACVRSRTANIELQAPTAAHFDRNRVDLQGLVNTIQVLVKFNCPDVNRITVRGKSRGVLYFAGVSAREQGWKLISLYSSR